jgi:hypothetical protein
LGTKTHICYRGVNQLFRESILPLIRQKYGNNDKIAEREAWNNFTDYLCKEGLISEQNYFQWHNPY